jgi:uncharacterized protein (UPF0147 family)
LTLSTDEENLNSEELEVALRALCAFQISLYDEMSQDDGKRVSLQTDMKNATSTIKKLHKRLEKTIGKMERTTT